MAEPGGGAAAVSTAEQPAPPPTIRRPRVREVSSRFMSPSIQSNPTPTPTPCPSGLPRSKPTHHRQPSNSDENQIPEVNRSFDRSSASIASNAQRKQQQQRLKQQTRENGEPKNHHHSDLRVSSRPGTPIAHSKENGESKNQHHSDVRVLSRPGTPIAMGTDRIVPSRYKQVSNSILRSNSLSSSSNGYEAVTAAARLLQEATSDMRKKLPKISTLSRDDIDTCSSTDTCSTTSNQGSSSCPNSPLCMPSNKLQSFPNMRSSMPDADKWLADRNSSNSGKIAGDCARSLNFLSSVKMGGGISLPPHPSSCVRSGLDLRKGRKASNYQEDVHSLKMLSNHYLQWRFANAKAEASVHAQKQEVEVCSHIFCHGVNILDHLFRIYHSPLWS